MIIKIRNTFVNLDTVYTASDYKEAEMNKKYFVLEFLNGKRLYLSGDLAVAVRDYVWHQTDVTIDKEGDAIWR